jgi:hypothetical protein
VLQTGERVVAGGAALCDRLAPWVTVEQSFPDRALADPVGELRRQLRELELPPGAQVALAVGSRGIADLVPLVRALVEGVREAGATPYLVPAMGSHGGGTAQGQLGVLAGLGVTEESVGAPIRASMDTHVVGEVHGVEVHTDRVAGEADAVIVLARVKPHTDFRGPVESGVTKILAIGLGNHRGAESVHRVDPADFSAAISEAAALVMRAVPVVAAVAVVEDAHDRIALLEVLRPEEIARREPELLRLAAEWMPSLPFDDVDVLVVQEMGKDIAGTGMDPNITGRFYVPRPDARPRIGFLAMLSLRASTHGNATGMGLADVVTRRFAEEVDWRATYTNELTSRLLAGPKLPMVAADDQDAIAVAVQCLGLVPPEEARIAWIRNTLAITRLRMSLPLWRELEGDPRLSVVSEPERPRFVDGRLV